MSKIKETALYPPVKAYLQALGYEVKGEVGAADVVACRGQEPPLIVELKLGFSLQLFHQAVARQRVTDSVYVAVPRWTGRAGWKAFKANVGLCKRLALGVLSVDVHSGSVQAHSDPAVFQPRKMAAKKAALMREFAARDGDPNLGGMSRETIVTAYRQAAEKCAQHLAAHGPCRGRDVKEATGVARATEMMRANHYGWFEREGGGVYALSAAGRAALGRSAG
ncbi:DUF2161 domain-containing phosphodiesterase [uncultured Lentibacter sp.]|uniref:DUF2161 domain-containing phosphodiesterase n=1 Tax=uncultured Lentibacter sp. TaxID=1659309 RepID=UPI00260CBED0|nr:DUF2161 family putative PD-(D/E)XK-type phosphodiesterase [uncultured Lentibacter sp.]